MYNPRRSSLLLTILLLLLQSAQAQLSGEFTLPEDRLLNKKIEKAKCIDYKPDLSLPRTDSLSKKLNAADLFYELYSLKIGSVVPDFSLLRSDSTVFHLEDELKKYPGILFISGSYTCPVFRNKISEINALHKRFKDSIPVYVVYVSEAHPTKEESYYCFTTGLEGINEKEGIFHTNARKMQTRMEDARMSIGKLNIQCPVLLDDAKNAWIKKFGFGANMCYLIGADGKVVQQHNWFNRPPNNIEYDMLRLLGRNYPNPISYDGSFEIINPNTNAMAMAGTALMYDIAIKNPSASGVSVVVEKIAEYPEDWVSAYCINACYPPEVQQTKVYLKPGVTEIIHVQMSMPSVGDGVLKLNLHNEMKPDEKIHLDVQLRSVEAFEPPTPSSYSNDLRLHSMPEQGQLYLENLQPNVWSLQVFDQWKNLKYEVKRPHLQYMVNLTFLTSGLYQMVFTKSDGTAITREYYKP